MSIKQYGISLIELILFIVIIGVGVLGILGVMNQATAHSADPLVRKQALAVAESLLEEIELHSMSGVETGASRSDWQRIPSYNGYSSTGVTDMQGNAVAGLANYNVNVTVASATLHTLLNTSAVQITVAVTAPNGEVVQAVGYRANYE